MNDQPLYAGIEGGGTKFICAIGHSPVHVIDSVTLPTVDAPTTLARCVDFFLAAQQRHGKIAALGFACFGPIELHSGSANFGRMMATPKPGWTAVDVLEPFRSALNVPISLEVDVGAAALAELQLGAGRDVGSLAYVTVGTGVGGAIAPLDNAVSRLMHAEMGHLRVRRDPRDVDFAGICPFHGDCLEGLASGLAIQARWGCALDALPGTHPAASIIGGYLGQLAASITLLRSVERIVFGGGVMSNGTLLPHIRESAFNYLNGYIEPLKERDRMERYICPPSLGNQAGIAGSLLLARAAKLR
jgi:fructokinase